MTLPQCFVHLDAQAEGSGQGLDGLDAAASRAGENLLDACVVEVVSDAGGLFGPVLVQSTVAVLASGVAATCVCMADEVDRHSPEPS